MDFASAMNRETTKKLTENGATAFSSTGVSDLLDLYATVGGMRARQNDVANKFNACFDENPLLATRLMFYTRDIRGGLGERDSFRSMLKQLSIFAENKKCTMQQITQILFENDVNILGSVNNDSAEYGIVRMVVSDPDKAEQALQAAGYMTRQTDVLGVEVVDQPGNLNSLLKTLLETNIDIDYIYLSFNRESGCPIMVFHVPDVYETEASLKSKGYTVL